MKIVFTELGDNLTKNGTTFHYGEVTIDGKDYDFSLSEMYDENSDSSTFEYSIEGYDGDIDGDLFVEELDKVKEDFIAPQKLGETYLGETKDFMYFRDEAYNTPIMYRLSDNQRYAVEAIVEAELINDVVEGNMIKISPAFIYDYQEIIKEGKNLTE